MKIIKSVLFYFFLVAVLALAAGAQTPTLNSCPNPWPLKRGMVMYTYAHIDNATLDKIAARYDFAIEGYPQDIQYLKQKKAGFADYKYNSLSDNYVNGTGQDENSWLLQNATGYGVVDAEDVYIHFYKDTVVQLEGQNITIPGYGGGSATSKVQARVPVYYKNLSRMLVNFSTPQLRALNQAFGINALNNPIITNVLPDGIFYDNAFYSSTLPENIGLISGGEVLEHPTHAKIRSTAFSDWYWFQGEGLFLKEFRAYVEAHPNVVGNRTVKLQPNVANLPADSQKYQDAYVTLKAGHIVFEEFNCSPTRCTGLDMPLGTFQRHKAAVDGGVSSMETGYLSNSAGSYGGTFTDQEAIENNVGLDWVTRSANSGLGTSTYFNFNPVWQADVNLAQWSLNLLPITDADLGQPLGDPFLLTSGTDPAGQLYKVYARRFSCGMAIVRGREWNHSVAANTAVSVPLGGTYVPLTPDGLSLPQTSTYSLRAGQAKIFLSTSVTPPPGDHVAPAAPGGFSLN